MTYRIETGVPLPVRFTSRTAALRALEPGQSMLVHAPVTTASSIASQERHRALRKDGVRKRFTCRTVGEGASRIWRVE